jgi:AcrR family transcriptional regulator
VEPAPALEPKQQRSRETRQRLLDAAVEELLDRGYAGFTGGGVALRAGISRGAQQGHFPNRTTLTAEAVRHLRAQQTEELGEAVEGVQRGPERLRIVLDVIFAQYGSPRFAAMLELSMAARSEPELRAVIAAEERTISVELTGLSEELFGPEKAADRLQAERWATALAAVRGVALLKLLGHPEAAVERQWKATRRELLALLED